jgi:hypothetical protein
MQYNVKKFSHPCMVIVVSEIMDFSTAVSYNSTTIRGLNVPSSFTGIRKGKNLD